MSDQTFISSSSDQRENLVPRYLSMSVSPDSDRSISNPSSPDINMLEASPPGAGSPVDNLYNSTLTRGDALCGVTMNLNQTFDATPAIDSMNFWTEKFSLMSNEETGSESFGERTEDDGNSAATSPDSAGRDSRLSSCETSCRGSTENDRCSLSSGEMIVRSNSFCLEDQSLPTLSSLEESSISPAAAGCPACAAECNLLSVTLPGICEKSTEENTGPPCLGVTFIQADNWEREENNGATCSSVLALPSETEGGLLSTFICETSANCGNEAKFAEAELSPYFLETLNQGKTFVSAVSPMLKANNDIHTSTPEQNFGNKIPSLPSFSESPCTGNVSSPVVHPAARPDTSASPKQRLVVGATPSFSKVKKVEIKKFPKVDFSGIKCKIITRAPHQTAASDPASQCKPSQLNVNSKPAEAQRGTPTRASPAKVKSSSAVVSASTKKFNDAQRRGNAGAASVGATVRQCRQTAVDGKGKSRVFTPDHHRASGAGCSETEQAASSRASDASAQHAGNKTFCISSSEKSPDRGGQIDPKPAPKKGVSDKIEVRSGSTRPHCSPESLTSTSRPLAEKRATLRLSNSFTIPKADSHQAQTKSGSLDDSSPNNRSTGSSSRELKKISLVESSKSTTAGASCGDSASSFRVLPSPRGAKGTPLSQPPAPRPKTTTPSARQRLGTLGRDECRTPRAVGTLQFKHKNNAGSQRVQTPGEASQRTASGAGVKPPLNGSRPPQTPSRPSPMGPPLTPACRLPRKPLGPSRDLIEASAHSDLGQSSGNKQVPGGAAQKPTPFRSVVLRARHISAPGKNTGQALTTTCKPAASTGKAASPSTAGPLVRTPSARLLRPSGLVDKSKSKTPSRQQPPQQQASHQNQRTGPPHVAPASSTEVEERKDQNIQQLRRLLRDSNCRFEAVAVVLQQTLAERDEATRQSTELSQELVNLRGELVCSVHSSERLQREKEELRVALEDALQKVQQQHQKDLEELEQRLQSFYQAEWDKVHLTYQEEADKCKALMQQQMGELKANHESMQLELENSHMELQCVKQQHEVSLEELRKVHTQQLQTLDKTLKDTEATLSGQIQELTEENDALTEKLTAEENRRRELAEKTQKDSHTLYLEQELESLKVVLEMKTKQLHQLEKKLMEVDKLTEKNVKLDESLIKAMQENEDLKARMERHAALSRQLSTEQAVLQESLQKESKVNKRLSMENEELLWKLHNGDLSSPRKMSPTSTSPSHSFSLQSPRGSGLFSSPPVSPR